MQEYRDFFYNVNMSKSCIAIHYVNHKLWSFYVIHRYYYGQTLCNSTILWPYFKSRFINTIMAIFIAICQHYYRQILCDLAMLFWHILWELAVIAVIIGSLGNVNQCLGKLCQAYYYSTY